jgi:D-xylose transport system substrate-binding protein
MSIRNGGVKIATSLFASALLALGVAACGTTSDDSSDSSASSGGADSGTVGFLLPETKTTRYEAFDHPLFEKALSEMCPDCTLEYANSNQDAAQQQSQAESMLTKGIDVMVLDPVDAEAAEAIVNKAESQGVPVVSYDRLSSGPVSYYVSYVNKKVGELQGQELLKQIQANGGDASSKIVMINGAPTDPNAADFKAGAHSVLDGNVDIAKEFDTPDWSPDKAQSEMQSAISEIGADQIAGVYSANDGMAAGIVAAFKSAGVGQIPLTGQDSQIDGIQRVLSGDQSMTIYKAIGPETQDAAAMAVALIKGDDYPDATETVNNGSTDVPSQLLDPVAVTADNVEDTVIKDGFYDAKDICTGEYAAACKKYGVQ